LTAKETGVSLLEIAQPRYIEAPCLNLLWVIYSPKSLTGDVLTVASGTNNLPVKFPLLLQGQKVLQWTFDKVLPHNFNELIDASIKILKETFTIYRTL
jgi:topoisomerase-4 subunit A